MKSRLLCSWSQPPVKTQTASLLITLLTSVLLFGLIRPGQCDDSKSNHQRPRVLILGDSISIGYTPFVQSVLSDEAKVIRPMKDPKNPENCAGTQNGVKAVERWLKIGGGDWDVIHFNFGLHDMKRVDPQTGEPSNNALHLRQSGPDAYARQLEQIVMNLKATGAKLIFATTTPVPSGKVQPYRNVEDPARYNSIAVNIMKKHGVMVDDLYGFTLPRLNEIQRPANVHFTEAGSELLAREVVRHIRAAL